MKSYPETGAGVGGTNPAAGPDTENAVGDDIPTTPHMGDASDGGEFSSPSPLNNEDEGQSPIRCLVAAASPAPAPPSAAAAHRCIPCCSRGRARRRRPSAAQRQWPYTSVATRL